MRGASLLQATGMRTGSKPLELNKLKLQSGTYLAHEHTLEGPSLSVLESTGGDCFGGSLIENR